MKNCLSCKYQPEWEAFNPYNGQKRSIGHCSCPMPLNESTPPVIWMVGAGVYKGAIGLDTSKILHCPAHEPKED